MDLEESERQTALTEPCWVLRADRGTLRVTGADRVTWINGLLTCDATKVAPGVGSWGLVLTKPGKVLADVVLVSEGDAVLLSVPREGAPELLEYLERFLIMEDADISEESDRWAWIEVHGPGAHTATLELGQRFGGTAAAVDFATGLPASVLAVPSTIGSKSIEDTAREVGVVPMGAVAWRVFRVARFLPAYGIDFDARQNPHEASLDRRAVSWEKGCYLGQEAVCMQDMRGKVKRRLVPLIVDGPEVPRGAEVRTLGEPSAPIGEVRSTAPLGSERSLAFALVAASAASIGTELRVEGLAAKVGPRGAAP